MVFSAGIWLTCANFSQIIMKALMINLTIRIGVEENGTEINLTGNDKKNTSTILTWFCSLLFIDVTRPVRNAPKIFKLEKKLLSLLWFRSRLFPSTLTSMVHGYFHSLPSLLIVHLLCFVWWQILQLHRQQFPSYRISYLNTSFTMHNV